MASPDADRPDPRAYLEPAATRVRDPVSGRSVWLAGMIKDAAYGPDGSLRFTLAVRPEHGPDVRRSLLDAVVANLPPAGWEGPVSPRLADASITARSGVPDETVPGMTGSEIMPHGGPIVKSAIPGVAHIVAVASGKGGVGKSTVAANLAVACKRAGLRVGLVDADVHGPSQQVMLNLTQKPGVADDGRLVPVSAYGVKCLSTGLLVDPNEAMIWRGPMVMGVVRQFLQQAHWGELDVMFVDLPPGTGDAQLTLLQAVPLAGAIVVTTPQDVALADAVRGLEMFRRLDVPVLGVVENMAWYTLPDGTKDFVFGDGGGARLADRYEVPLLARLPLKTSVRKGADQGLPAALGRDDIAETFGAMASRIATTLGLVDA